MYVLQDHVTGQFHRFSPETYQIIGLMDGDRSLEQIWGLACEKLGDDMPTQTDMINLLSRLYRANAIVTDRIPDIEELDVRRREFGRRKVLQQLKSPLSIKIPLIDPDNFLTRTMPVVRPCFSTGGFVVWITTVLTGLVLAAVHWENLTTNIADRVVALENILLIGLTYPFVKIIHELGHAYCVKRWGGEVHEIGIMLLVFFPVPYVDATSATSFRSKYRRILVGAAGIVVEVFLAALAMILWVIVEEGAFRAVLFNIMLISGVSTVLFNGNPLLRYDAYYVLTDLLEIPNLAMRSNAYIGYLVKRYLFGMHETASPVTAGSEAAWLAAYSMASFLYRFFLVIVITLFVASRYFLFGSIIGIWFIYSSVMLPLIKILTKPVTDPLLRRNSKRIYLVGGAITCIVLLVIFVFPVPLATRAEGVTWVPEQAHIYADESGFIDAINAGSNDHVERDSVLVEMSNPELEMQAKVLAAQVKESEARYKANLGDKNLAEVLKEDYLYVMSQYQRARERLIRLQIRAKLSGNLVIPGYENMIDRFIKRGQVLGYIADYNTLPVNVMVPGDDIEYVMNNTDRVELRFVSHPADVFFGRITRVTPSASRNLISPVLSVQGGGNIALDPNSKNQAQTFGEYYNFEIEVPEARSRTTDERVYVLFRHKAEPMAKRWYRSVRRVFLRTFSV
jgi:putative peptide zinc metalloprotease protein